MGDLYSELLVKKDKTAKDSLVKIRTDRFDSTGSICRTFCSPACTDPGHCIWNCMLFCDSKKQM